MKLYELLNKSAINENVSVESSIKHIIDILSNELPMLYNKIKHIQNPMIVGRMKSDWYHKIFFSHMKPALYNLLKSLPSHIGHDLRLFLDNEISSGNFRNIEDALVYILEDIAELIKNDRLKQAAKNAENTIQRYHAGLDGSSNKLDNKPESGKHDAEPKKDPNIISQQRLAVDNIVNGVLSKLDKKVAGDIRNAIAKQDNKLVALQAELARRNIKI